MTVRQPDPDASPLVTVTLPGPLLRLFPGAPSMVELRAFDVRDALSELDRRWPGMGDRLSDTSPAIRRHLNVFVDGRRAQLDTRLEPGSEVFIVTAMSGG